MTYRAGIHLPGYDPTPRVICDECGEICYARIDTGMPPRWLLNGKAPRGWKCIPLRDGGRIDVCPDCVRPPSL